MSGISASKETIHQPFIQKQNCYRNTTLRRTFNNISHFVAVFFVGAIWTATVVVLHKSAMTACWVVERVCLFVDDPRLFFAFGSVVDAWTHEDRGVYLSLYHSNGPALPQACAVLLPLAVLVISVERQINRYWFQHLDPVIYRLRLCLITVSHCSVSKNTKKFDTC